MAENDGNDRGPVSRGGIAPQPLFAVGAVLLGSFLANFDSRLTSVGLLLCVEPGCAQTLAVLVGKLIAKLCAPHTFSNSGRYCACDKW